VSTLFIVVFPNIAEWQLLQMFIYSYDVRMSRISHHVFALSLHVIICHAHVLQFTMVRLIHNESTIKESLHN